MGDLVLGRHFEAAEAIFVVEVHEVPDGEKNANSIQLKAQAQEASSFNGQNFSRVPNAGYGKIV